MLDHSTDDLPRDTEAPSIALLTLPVEPRKRSRLPETGHLWYDEMLAIGRKVGR